MQTVALPPSLAVTMVKLPEDPGHKQLVIAAIGEAGEGKSTLLNLLLNAPGDQETFFAVSDEPEACTLVPRFRWLVTDPGYSYHDVISPDVFYCNTTHSLSSVNSDGGYFAELVHFLPDVTS